MNIGKFIEKFWHFRISNIIFGSFFYFEVFKHQNLTIFMTKCEGFDL